MNFKPIFAASNALQARIDGLEKLARQIETTNGMSKAFALEALDYMPGFGNGISTAYYTQQPSYARYHVSLEEINGGMIALIAAGIAALIAIIYKAIKYFFPNFMGGSSSSGGGGGGFSEKSDKIKDSDAKVEKTGEVFTLMNNRLSEYPATEASKKAGDNGARRLNDLVGTSLGDKESKLSKMLEVSNPLVMDALNDGPYFTLMKGVEGTIVETQKMMERTKEVWNNFRIVMDLIKSNKKLDPSDPALISNIAYFNGLKEAEVLIHFSGEDKTFAGFSSYITGIHDGIVHQKGATLKTIEDYPAMVKRSVANSKIFGILHTTAACGPAIVEFQKELEAAQTLFTSLHNADDNNNRQLTNALANAMKVVKHNAQGALSMYNQVNKFTVVLIACQTQLEKMMEASAEIIHSVMEMRKAPPEVIKEASSWQKGWEAFSAGFKSTYN